MRRLFSLCISCITTLAMQAQQQNWITVDWAEQNTDSIIPYGTCVFPLPNDFAQHQYQVRLEYPEYEAMHRDEARKWQRLLNKKYPELHIGTQPEVDTHIGVARKVGQMDVSVLPIIKKDGKYYKLKSAKMTLLQADSETAQVASRGFTETRAAEGRYASHSVLATGTWVKIEVSESGVYCLTAADVKKMGFTDLSRIKVYGYGGAMQSEKINADTDYDDLEEIPLLRTDKGALFYAQGPISWASPLTNSSGYEDRSRIFNPYSTKGYYFVTEGEAPATMSTTTIGTEGLTSQTTFREHSLYEKDDFNWHRVGRNLYDAYDFAQGNKKKYSIPTPDAYTNEVGSLRIVMTAGNNRSTSVTVNVDGNTLSTFSLNSLSEYVYATASTQKYPAVKVNDGVTEVTISTTAGNTAHLDYLLINYTRKLQMSGNNALAFSGKGSKATLFQIQGADAHTQVWKLGHRGCPVTKMEGSLQDGILSVAVDQANDNYVAVNTAASFPSPTIVGKIENQDLHASQPFDMLILVPTSAKWMDQAERLAQAHQQHNGLRVKVVKANQVYNEFSSGTPDATAYRRYLKMMYDRAATPSDAPRYLLLMGDGAWDNRMLCTPWRNYNPNDYLLTYESDNSITDTQSYVMEDYFGLLDDGEGADLLRDKPDLGVGRFPVRTAEQAKIMVDKTISYMNNTTAASWKNNIFVMADDGENNQHMSDAENVFNTLTQYYPEYMTKRIYWDAYTRESTATGFTFPEATKLVQQAMNDGALIMDYTGHGAPYCLSHEKVIQLSDFANSVTQNYPLWFTAACDVAPFDSQEETIGETAVLNANGGAIAFYGTTRAVYPLPNNSLNRNYLYNVLGKDSNGTPNTIGDASRISKCALVTTPLAGTTTDRTVNKLQYVLLGDPALALQVPTYKVVIDKVNESNTNQYEEILPAGSVATLTGHIETSNGEIASQFNGTLYTSVFDSSTTVECHNYDRSADKPMTFEEYDRTLFNGIDSVSNGIFQFSFPVPVDIKYEEAEGLMSFYAVSNDYQNEAHGRFTDFMLNGTAETMQNDSIGPELYIFLNDPDFLNGAPVGGAPIFVAQIKDKDGINTSGNGIGHDLQLVIDGDAANAYNLNEYYTNNFGDYTSGKVVFPLPELEVGKHQLMFRAWDVYNNCSQAYLDFQVVGGTSSNAFDVTCTRNPVVGSTSFIVTTGMKGKTYLSVEIFDMSGRKLFDDKVENTTNGSYYLYNWAPGTGGFPSGSGIYLFRFGVKGETGDYTYKTKKIIVLRQ